MLLLGSELNNQFCATATNTEMVQDEDMVTMED